MTLLKNFVLTFLGPAIFTIGIPFAILRSGLALPVELGAARYGGLLVLGLGALIGCWCMWAFVAIGHGMPNAFDPPVELVVQGLYRLVRNPMFSGVLLIIVGEALWYESAALAILALLAWGFAHFVIVRYEEPTLRRRFSASYERYLQTVPRWFPRLGLTLRSPVRLPPASQKKS